MGRAGWGRMVGLFAAGLTLAACSSAGSVQAGNQAATAPLPTTSTTSTTSTTAPTTTTTAPQYLRSWTLTSTDAKGDAETSVLSIGNVERYSPNDRAGDFTAGTTCNLDTQTDAVVPAHLITINTTKDFNLTTSVSMGSLSVQWEVDYSNGPQCEGAIGSPGAPSLTVNSTNPLAPGAAVTTNLFFIFPNYYTPNQPAGNPALLDAAVTFSGLSISQEGGRDVSLTGPGASDVYTPGIWEFAVSGNTPTF